MGVILSIYEAEKSIGARNLFRGLTFGLDEGARVGLVGPNGSGKSTLLKALAGLTTLEGGQVTWSNRIQVQYVSQNPEFDEGETLESFLLKNKKADLGNPKTSALMWESFSRLNVSNLDLGQKFEALSGGARKKAQIVRALLSEPQVLLMDEPTNHLDVESIMWLEDFLKSRSGLTLFLISHDRLFLQNVVSEIIELNPAYRGGYIRATGGYADYLELKEATLTEQNVQQRKKENDLRRETEWLRRGAQARQTKQTARIKSAQQLMNEVEELRGLNQKRDIAIDLQTGVRTPKKLIEVSNLTLARSGELLVKDLSVTINRRTRLGLLGRNGCGKSTLIQFLLETDMGRDGIDVLNGEVKRAEGLGVSYFEQHRTELDFNSTLLQNICSEGDYVQVGDQSVYAKSYLDRFRFRRDQHDLKVRELSGGEQNRLMIAKMMGQKSQLMVLDEPTNDLDFETLESLKQALQEFDGAIILVSHDRTFMDEVCEEILYFSPFPEDDKRLVKFTGFLQWQDWFIQRENRTREATRSSSASVSSLADKTSPKKVSKKLGYMEQRELASIEEVIQLKEKELENIKGLLADPDVASDPQKTVEISQQMSIYEQEVHLLYERWQFLENKNNKS